MKKILLIWNGIFSKQISGGDVYTINLINLGKSKKDLIIPKGVEKTILKEKINKIYFTKEPKNKGFFFLLLLYLLRTFKTIIICMKIPIVYDNVIASSPFLFDVLPLCFVKSKNKTVIIFHTIPERKSIDIKTKIRFFIAKIENKISYWLINKNINIVLAGNSLVKQELSKKLKNKKIIVISAGIDTEKIDSVENIKKDKNLACFIGRLVTQKGILDLVDIVKEILQFNNKFRLIAIGDGPDRNLIEEKIKEYELKDKIIIRGFLSEEEKIKILKKSNFFLFPSYEEGWGIALAEALYCKCLCFTYKLPHYEKVFKNYPIYISLGNKKEFIDVLKKEYFKRVSQRQKKFMKRYSYLRVIREIEKEL